MSRDGIPITYIMNRWMDSRDMRDMRQMNGINGTWRDGHFI